MSPRRSSSRASRTAGPRAGREHLRIATCRPLPEPDPDEELLRDALAARGVASRMAAWDDPGEPWDRPEPTLVRSTWNYHLAPEAFAAWIDRVASRAPLWNPRDVLRWNLHKRYLLELEGRGIPVVPTRLVERGSRARLAQVLEGTGWTDVVIKPAISCASFGTIRVGSAEGDRGERHLASLLAGRDVLVQPYTSSVDRDGERALVIIDGIPTHAVVKSARFSGQDERVSGALPVTPEEAELVARVLEPFGTLLYARLDVARGPDGSLLVMELELMEPSLFLAQHPPALERFADAVAARLEG